MAIITLPKQFPPLLLVHDIEAYIFPVPPSKTQKQQVTH